MDDTHLDPTKKKSLKEYDDVSKQKIQLFELSF